MKISQSANLQAAFNRGELGIKTVPKWDEYGRGWWQGTTRVCHSVPADWPFSSSGFPGDWEAYARFKAGE